MKEKKRLSKILSADNYLLKRVFNWVSSFPYYEWEEEEEEGKRRREEELSGKFSMRERERVKEEEQEKEISGWLSAFLSCEHVHYID